MIRSDRLVALSLLAVSVGEDNEVGELVLSLLDVMQGRGVVVGLTEVCPDAEDLCEFFLVLASCGRGSDSERSAEISLEAGSGGS